MTPANKAQMVEARRRFAGVIAQPVARIDLAHAALLIAKEENPRFSVAHYLALLDEFGGAARGALAEVRGDRTIETFNYFMFERLGFTGNADDYYDARNSLLPDVLDRRRGIPITLSIVYMEVGRRAGLKIEGVGLPGHFIVRVSGSNDSAESTLVDPFNCRTIDAEDCQAQLDTLYGGQIALAAEHLRTVTTKEILARVLRNLGAIYTNAKLYRQALTVTERIMMVAPQLIDERRTRAVALAELNRLPEAIQDLEAYLRLAPDDSADKQRAEEQLNALRMRLAGLN